MNQEKVGAFIAERRKAKQMTQAVLAEKLGITDRAVSKWERGKGMPDVSLMLELCEILDITVNELLSGENIEMEDYKKKTEELLLEMAKSEEEKNKKLLKAMYLISFVSLAGLLVSTLLIGYYMQPGTMQNVFMIISLVVFLIPVFIGFQFEVQAGYYACKNCGHRFTTTYVKALWAPHVGTTRYLKCPECGKRGMCKKVLKK